MLRLSHKLLTLHVRSLYTKEKSELLGTLHLRFFNYLKQNKELKCDDKLLKLIQSVENVPLDKIGSEKFKQIDNECLRSIGSISNDEVYGLVDTLIEFMPQQIGKLKTFPEALRLMTSNFKKSPDRNTFIRLCFYLGQLKKTSPGPETLATLIDRHIDLYIDDMSTTDVSIVATSTYKASVKVRNERFTQRMISEITRIETIDSFIFITFIKSLRQNRIKSPEVFKKLKQLKDNSELDNLSPSALVHTFMLIADNSIKDDDLTKFFIEKCASSMDSSESRVKEAQKLLYSCALLNTPVQLDHLKKLEHLVMSKTSSMEYEQKFDNFVDAALSLWMLNHRPKELVMKLLNDKRFFQTGDRSRIKLDSRKKLLLTCVEIEEPQWIAHLNIASPSFDAQRPAPHYLIKPSIEKARRKFRGQDLKVVQQIQHLNIAGIFDRHRNVHIEILDDSNTLSDKKSPNGILVLKLRLLKQMSCEVRLVRESFLSLWIKVFNGTVGF